MNEVLRILDKILKKRGYAIKKHPEYNLLPLKNLDGFNDQERIYASFNSVNKGDSSNSNNVGKLEVCLRIDRLLEVLKEKGILSAIDVERVKFG